MKRLTRTYGAIFILLSLTALMLAAFFSREAISGQAGKKKATLVAETSQAMSSAWNKGTLPKPLPVPGGSADAAIALLAKKIAAKNEESIPALMTALRMAGFFITDKAGNTMLAPADGKGQGLPVNGWEVASMAKMYGDGKTTTLVDLSDKLTSIPEFKQAGIADFLLKGIRANAGNRQNEYLRNWARLIVELGKHSADKTDLLEGARPEQASLDAIQHFLLMRRLYGDVIAVSAKYKLQEMASSRHGYPSRTDYAVYRPDGRPPFMRASHSANKLSPARFGGYDDVAVLRVDASGQEATGDKQIPCRMDGNAPTVMDASATVLGVGFGELTGYLEDFFEGDRAQPGAIGKAARVLGVANTVLAYAKFIQTYAALESKIILEDAPPLVRTKNSQPGERKRLRTEVRANIGNWQMYNCIRMALNVTAGIDFSTLNDGPLGDVGIRWHLDEGGGKDVYSNSGGLTGKQQIVGFAQAGSARIQDKGTGAGVGDGAVKDATYTKTDDQGVARIFLEGSPQKNFKGPNAVAVAKRVKIRTTIKMKAGEIKGDMVDVAGQAIAGVPGLITMPLEILYRMDWASVAELTVPVRDWEDCEGKGWNGTVEVGFHNSENRSDKPVEGAGIQTYKWSYDYNALFSVKNSPEETYEESGRRYANLMGTLTAEAARITDEKKSWSIKGDCGKAGVDSSSNMSERGKLSSQIDDGSLQINGQEFKITFLISDIPAKHRHITSVRHYGWCGENQDGDTDDEDATSFSMEGITIEGTLDPKNPNLIEGGRTFKDEMGNTVTQRWSLRMCR